MDLPAGLAGQYTSLVVAPRLELRQVTYRVGASPILRGVDLDCLVDGITVIAGSSGSGKTSLLRQLNRLDAPTSGTVLWNGVDVATEDVTALRRRVGHIAQRPAIFEGSVLENLRVADSALGSDEAAALLARTGLDVELDQVAETLSGGEAQRLCLARTLATGASIVLADEPTSALDSEATMKIERLARDLVDADGLAWIWVSHDVEQMRRLADRVIAVADGIILACGPLDQLANDSNPIVRQTVGQT